jgi:hypothetical protein
MSRASCRVTETQALLLPLVGASSGTTTGPATPAGASWMCAARAGAMPDTVSV